MEHNGDPTARSTTGSGPRPVTTVEAEAPASRYCEGDVIAEKYQLGRRLGQGGMGEVWLAHNQTLDIDVAVKLIRTQDEVSEEMTDRLLTEARAAARLGHPAIVRVNDFGKTERGDPFIVMERLRGEDLADTLTQVGRLSAIKAVRTLLPIVHALAAAHTKGIVHRDLKPENIYLAKTDEGQIHPKLVDFGIAKLEARYPGHVAQTGALLGSPLYMSPEQARGDDVDHRADIWALGVVLYELVAGRPPFEGKNYNAVLYSIVANPPTSLVDLGVGDTELWAILERALQKDPDRRWYSMRDFGEALATWLEDHGVTDDITGASLQTTWLQWKKEGDQLASAPPTAGPESTSAPPTTANIPPPPALPARLRQDTLKTARTRRSQHLPLAVAGGAVILIAVAAAVALSQQETVVEGGPLPEAIRTSEEARDEDRSSATAVPVPAPATPEPRRSAPPATDPADTPVDETADHEPDLEPAVEASALPPAEDSPPAETSAGHDGPSAAPRGAPPTRVSPTPRVRATRTRHKSLKNPFE